jgi:hypothetical protein
LDVEFMEGGEVEEEDLIAGRVCWEEVGAEGVEMGDGEEGDVWRCQVLREMVMEVPDGRVEGGSEEEEM